jgi:hypothetical protein
MRAPAELNIPAIDHRSAAEITAPPRGPGRGIAQFVSAVENAEGHGPRKNAQAKTGGALATLFSKTTQKTNNKSTTQHRLADIENNAIDEHASRFREWFLQSKITDDLGTPLLLYHGTPSGDIAHFLHEKSRQSSIMGEGFYFTTSAADASENYASPSGSDASSRIAELANDLFCGACDDPAIAGKLIRALAEEDPEFNAQMAGALDLPVERFSLDDLSGSQWDKLIEDFIHPATDHAASKEILGDGAYCVYPVHLAIRDPLIIAAGGTAFALKESSTPGQRSVRQLRAALRTAARDFAIAEHSVRHLIDYINTEARHLGKISAAHLFEAARYSLDLEIETAEGEAVDFGAWFAAAARRMGFDGVAMDAHAEFGPNTSRRLPHVTPGVLHVTAFDDSQVRFALPWRPAVKSLWPHAASFTTTPTTQPVDDVDNTGRRLHATTAGVANFRKWFEGSCVVDDTGLPRLVYRGEHGADLPGRHYNGSPHFQSRVGALSFGCLEDANLYATEPNHRHDNIDAPRVYPAYLRIVRPFQVNDNPADPFLELRYVKAQLGLPEALRIARKFAGHVENTNQWQEFMQPLVATEENPEPTVQAFLDAMPDRVGELYFDAYPFFDDPEEVARLRALGFDGCVHGGNGAGAFNVEYKVFDAAAVKSALGNSGRFVLGSDDPYDPAPAAAENTPMFASESANDSRLQDDERPRATRRRARP